MQAACLWNTDTESHCITCASFFDECPSCHDPITVISRLPPVRRPFPWIRSVAVKQKNKICTFQNDYRFSKSVSLGQASLRRARSCAENKTFQWSCVHNTALLDSKSPVETLLSPSMAQSAKTFTRQQYPQKSVPFRESETRMETRTNELVNRVSTHSSMHFERSSIWSLGS